MFAREIRYLSAKEMSHRSILIVSFQAAVARNHFKKVRGMLGTNPWLASAPDPWGNPPLKFAKDREIILLIRSYLPANPPPNPRSFKFPKPIVTDLTPKKPGLPSLTVEECVADFLEEEGPGQNESLPSDSHPEPLSSSKSLSSPAPEEMGLLASMFPDLPAETLALVLHETSHDVQAAIDLLLGEDNETTAESLAKEVPLDSEAEFPSLLSGPKPSFQPPRTTNLVHLDPAKTGPAVANDAEVESVEWVGHEDYDGYEEYEEVPDVNDGRSCGSVVLVEDDPWDVVSQTSELSFVDLARTGAADDDVDDNEDNSNGEKPMAPSFAAALKANLGKPAKVNQKAPRIPPSSFVPEGPKKGMSGTSDDNDDDDDDEGNDLYSPKDSERVFGRQSKPRKSGRSGYKTMNKPTSKPSKGIR